MLHSGRVSLVLAIVQLALLPVTFISGFGPKSALQSFAPRGIISPVVLQSQQKPVVDKPSETLTEKQLDFTLGYLNKHHQDLLTEFAKAFSSVGVEEAKQNVWSGGSYVIENAEITDINKESLELKVAVQVRGKGESTEVVSVDLGKYPIVCSLALENIFGGIGNKRERNW
jgi:hypothetical protein